MGRFISHRPSPALAVSIVALFAALTGGAVALPGTKSVDSGDIVNNSIKSKDIKNGTIQSKDVKKNSLGSKAINEKRLGEVPTAASAKLAAVAQSASFATAAAKANDANALDGKDSTAFRQYGGTIPHGKTVVGNWYAAPSKDIVGSFGFFDAPLPARAPVALTNTTSNMGAGTAIGADNDPACSGNVNSPTAPPGKLCWYLSFYTVGAVTAVAGYATGGNPFYGGDVRVTRGAVGAETSAYARGTWAYTAP
jgi:hypothetical protein